MVIFSFCGGVLGDSLGSEAETSFSQTDLWCLRECGLVGCCAVSRVSAWQLFAFGNERFMEQGFDVGLVGESLPRSEAIGQQQVGGV